MWKRTKPRSMIPVTAMTHFLPTAERQKRTIGFPEGRPGWTGAGPCSVVDCVAVTIVSSWCSRLLGPPLGCAAATYRFGVGPTI